MKASEYDFLIENESNPVTNSLNSGNIAVNGM